jgi:hypothetical protein
MRVAILTLLSAGFLAAAPGNAAPLPFPLPPVTLTVTVAQGAGGVTSAPVGIDCGVTCSAPFAWGTPIQLTATPAAGSVVTGWSGACAGTTGPTCTFVLSANTSVAVSFARPTLTVVVQDMTPLPTPRGWVTSNGAGSHPGIDCGPSCSAGFDAGTVVTLWAIPFAGSIFAGWTGACSSADTCVVTMDQARSVTAVFDFPWSPTDIKSNFTVLKNGSGSGTVTSGPPGISCGSGCGARYPSNVNVTLTATAAEGSHVAGWSGPCAGVGTATTCVVTVGPATGVTVTFDLNRSAASPATPAPQAPVGPQEPVKPQEPEAPAAKTITTGPSKLQVVRSARRVIHLELTLRTGAECHVRLLRRGATILSRNVKTRPGRNAINLAASRQLRKGYYRFEVVLTNDAGLRQRLSWPVRL